MAVIRAHRRHPTGQLLLLYACRLRDLISMRYLCRVSVSQASYPGYGPRALHSTIRNGLTAGVTSSEDKLRPGL